MQLSPEAIANMLALIELGGDDGDMPEPPEAETLEQAALRVGETLLEQAVASYAECLEVLKRGEINAMMALHLAQKIPGQLFEERLEMARTIRASVATLSEEVDEMFEDLLGDMSDIAAASSSPEPIYGTA